MHFVLNHRNHATNFKKDGGLGLIIEFKNCNEHAVHVTFKAFTREYSNCGCAQYLYHNYEKYLLSPLKPRFLVLIEQYLPNISDPVYSVHQSFM